MPEHAGSPRVWALAAALRDARTASGLGVRELARKLKMSPSMLSSWELGRRVPNLEQVAVILGSLGTPPEERERIIRIARHVKESNWLSVGINGVSEQLSGVVECERAASQITEWHPVLIPGLLQTPDYAQLVVSENGRKSDVDHLTMVRIGRTRIINRSNPIHFTALIAETALRDQIITSALMVDQLEYLIFAARKDNISLWVLRSGIGWHPGYSGPFILYEFPESPPVVYFEHYSSGAFVPNPDNINAYKYAIDILKETALPPSKSISLIEQIAAEWRTVT